MKSRLRLVRHWVAGGAGAVLSCLAGCASVGLQRASTLGQGKGEASMELCAQGLYSPSSLGSPSSVRSLPAASLRFQRGVTDRLDLGLRAGSPGLELLAKVQLTPPASQGVIVSLAPSAGALFLPGGVMPLSRSFLQATLLTGIPIAGRHQLVFGARGQQAIGLDPATDGGGFSSAFTLGGSLGFSFVLGDTGGGPQLMAEVASMFPLRASRAAAGELAVPAASERVVQLGLALSTGI
jgi:hypothetical protein